MPEIKNTTAAEALAEARARLDDAYQTALRSLQNAHELAASDLATRESALSEVNGIIQRAKHVWVKDFAVHPQSSNVHLGDTRIALSTGHSVRMVDPNPWSDIPVADRPSLEPGKTYRFWLLIEEVPNAGAGA